ncbi:hypothetical protein DFJ58DRAFT_775067 [Suillus subalutaceus]|uniref:uncharacterized protein n=1 Tax=Suillus subalutaceus TaxID=48586 RepID=UPI001B867358|nr:uncharacterized protein DFJ58DRAFT_775067 [Suillus subalutaceus]KAG1862776.1 hypothetical protein DFJ58DRAFT_775067 [Suillus subalutaceus]
MRLATFNVSRHLFLPCPQRILPSAVVLRRTLPVLARRANISTADERTLIQDAVKACKGRAHRPRPLLYIHALTRTPPLPILRHALITASPAVRWISQKRSGKNDVRPAHIRAIVRAVLVTSKNKSGRTVEERLAREIIAVVNGDSKANTDKELAHKQTVVNRGNALVK